MHIRIAGDPPHIAKRLFHRLPERDSDILRGMVMVDMQVTDRLDGDIDPGVAGKQIEHMVKEADPGGDRSDPTAVEIDRNGYVGFLGRAFYRCLAHVRFLRAESPRLVTGVAESRHCCPRGSFCSRLGKRTAWLRPRTVPCANPHLLCRR